MNKKPAADIPRRIDLERATPAELAIRAAVQAVEEAGADVRLTDAVVLLQQAKDRVADFVDGVKPETTLQPVIRCKDCGGTLIYSNTAEGYEVIHSCKDGKQVRDMIAARQARLADREIHCRPRTAGMDLRGRTRIAVLAANV